MIDATREKARELAEERDEYRRAMDDIAGVICAPNHRGQFRSDAANAALGRALDALSWPDRQRIRALKEKSSG